MRQQLADELEERLKEKKKKGNNMLLEKNLRRVDMRGTLKLQGTTQERRGKKTLSAWRGRRH